MVSRRIILRGAFLALAAGTAYKYRGLITGEEDTSDNILPDKIPLPTWRPEDKGKLQYIVIDADTGVTLLGRHAHKKQEPASLTKLMTLALVFEAMTNKDTKFNLSSLVTIPEYINRVGAGIAVFEGLKPGERYKARDLLIGAGSRSDSYSTLALAIHLGSSDVYNWDGNEAKKAEKFKRLMNQKADEIGMRDTNFAVITGLPNRKNISNPHDMALLMKYIKDTYPRAAEIALGQAKFNISAISKSSDHTSRLLKARPNEIEFAKTGWTNRAGYNLAVFAEKSGRNLIAIVMGADGRNHRNSVMKNILSQAVKIEAKPKLSL